MPTNHKHPSGGLQWWTPVVDRMYKIDLITPFPAVKTLSNVLFFQLCSMFAGPKSAF